MNLRPLVFVAPVALAIVFSQSAGDVEGQKSSLPKVVRVACTDHVCGGCDGKCHDPAGVQYDHVTVRREGHCTCTPRQGGDLDRAIREAYRLWTSQAAR